MLREKYWFLYMNSIIDNAIDQCYECLVATKERREEPIKTTSIPDNPWDTVSVDHGGPYPDGHYNLVIIEKRTRYPVVESMSSTSFQINKEKLKHIFATYGTSRRVETDNGPPFNSRDFEDFAQQEGFQHHRITPLHPRANGEAERFMQLMNKTERIAHLQGKDRFERQNAIHEMLTAYRSTPHPATGIPPYEAMRGAAIRTKLDYVGPNNQASEEDEHINKNDARYKQKMKVQRESSRTKEKRLLLGDYVLVIQEKKNKWSTPYEPIFYTVCEVQGSRITARRTTDGRTVCRDASHFKLVNTVINTADETKVNICERQPAAPIKQDDTTEIRTRQEQERWDKNRPNKNEQPMKPEEEPVGIESPNDIKQEEEDEEREEPQVQEQRTSRPQRERRKPRHLEDYHVYT
ncbi:hypothetical protein QZH41_000846 [Actinostola sp. cb2023]|nr:hypothetical protein QZH41_000846 [Actinostola sp. cb2023]